MIRHSWIPNAVSDITDARIITPTGVEVPLAEVAKANIVDETVFAVKTLNVLQCGCG